MGLRRDHGPDELECEANGTRLERRQPRRRAEGVSEQLLVDVHMVAAQLRVDRVAPAPEVDEVEQREVLLQGLGRDRKALHQLRRGDLRLALLATRSEQVREESLKHAEALRRDGACVPLGRLLVLGCDRPRHLRRAPLVPLAHAAQARRGCAPELVRPDRRGAAVEAQDPRDEVSQIRIRCDEDAVLDPTVPTVRAFDPPGCVARELDPSLADDLAHLPRGRRPVILRLEGRRKAEVALTARGEADVAPDSRDAERADVVDVVVSPDHVPAAFVGKQGEGVERALARLVPCDRPVLEANRPLLGDRGLELAQPPGELG